MKWQVKWRIYAWTIGSLALFCLLSLALPTYASFFAIPVVVALSFQTTELRALVSSACLGIMLDATSELFPFGFFAIVMPAKAAFLFSLEHFFKKRAWLALTCTLFLTVVLALLQAIWIAVTRSSAWTAELSFLSYVLIIASLLVVNGLITWGLYHGQEQIDKLYSGS